MNIISQSQGIMTSAKVIAQLPLHALIINYSVHAIIITVTSSSCLRLIC